MPFTEVDPHVSKCSKAALLGGFSLFHGPRYYITAHLCSAASFQLFHCHSLSYFLSFYVFYCCLFSALRHPMCPTDNNWGYSMSSLITHPWWVGWFGVIWIALLSLTGVILYYPRWLTSSYLVVYLIPGVQMLLALVTLHQSSVSYCSISLLCICSGVQLPLSVIVLYHIMINLMLTVLVWDFKGVPLPLTDMTLFYPWFPTVTFCCGSMSFWVFYCCFGGFLSITPVVSLQLTAFSLCHPRCLKAMGHLKWCGSV